MGFNVMPLLLSEDQLPEKMKFVAEVELGRELKSSHGEVVAFVFCIFLDFVKRFQCL